MFSKIHAAAFKNNCGSQPGHELLFGRRVNQTSNNPMPSHRLFNGRRLSNETPRYVENPKFRSAIRSIHIPRLHYDSDEVVVKNLLDEVCNDANKTTLGKIAEIVLKNMVDKNGENYKEAIVHFKSLNMQNQSQYIWDIIMSEHGYRFKYDVPVVQVVTLKKY